MHTTCLRTWFWFRGLLFIFVIILEYVALPYMSFYGFLSIWVLRFPEYMSFTVSWVYEFLRFPEYMSFTVSWVYEFYGFLSIWVFTVFLSIWVYDLLLQYFLRSNHQSVFGFGLRNSSSTSIKTRFQWWIALHLTYIHNWRVALSH